MFARRIRLPKPGTHTFFLWGPRQTGKSTLLRSLYPEALTIDLLGSDDYRRFLARPQELRELVAHELGAHELGARDRARFVVIDEIQKLPELLDEVHWLHENRGVRFALCGSSARKVRRGHANLLGGRALRFELMGLTSEEIGDEFDLEEYLNTSSLPGIFRAEDASALLRAYVTDYLREEVAAEGLVRRLPAFSAFLDAAALSDAELVNFASIARECGVSQPTARGYFEILEDTLLTRWLPAYTKRPKRRVIGSPKLYFADSGVASFLARRGRLTPGSEAFGKAFENWIHHELTAYEAYSGRWSPLTYWRLASGIEVDFLIDDARVAIEAKASRKVTTSDLNGLRQLRVDHPKVERRIVVSLEHRPRQTEDGIDIWPYRTFTAALWSGELDRARST